MTRIVLIGTAHVSQESSDLVAAVIEAERPDTVCVELCASRYQSIRLKDQWQNMDIVKVIKEKKTFLLLSNLILAAFQKRIAAKLDIVPGAEMIRAIEAADASGAAVHLADREIRVTLSRAWKAMTFWEKKQAVVSFAAVFCRSRGNQSGRNRKNEATGCPGGPDGGCGKNPSHVEAYSD